MKIYNSKKVWTARWA